MPCNQFSFSCPARAHFAWRAQGPHQPMPILALAVLPVYPLHGVPQDLLACTLPYLQLPLQGTIFAESPETPLITSTSASAILPRCPLCIEPWVPWACTHHSFIYFTRASSAQTAQGPPGPHITSVPATPATLPRHPLHTASWDRPICTHFSFQCPARVPSAHRTLGYPDLHPLQFYQSWQGTLYVGSLRTPSPCQPQLQPASKFTKHTQST